MNQIHFNFIVDTGEAEVIYNGVQQQINKCNEQILSNSYNLKYANPVQTESITSLINWYKSHKEYLQNILNKMKSSVI